MITALIVFVAMWTAFLWGATIGVWAERRVTRTMPLPHDYEGCHKWGDWSKPYRGNLMWWQERRCQCGNRDFRLAEKADA